MVTLVLVKYSTQLKTFFFYLGTSTWGFFCNSFYLILSFVSDCSGQRASCKEEACTGHSGRQVELLLFGIFNALGLCLVVSNLFHFSIVSSFSCPCFLLLFFFSVCVYWGGGGGGSIPFLPLVLQTI